MNSPFLKQTIREERHRINEDCFWCLSNSIKINPGTIINESATGALVRVNERLDMDKKIYVLSIPGGLPPIEAISAEILKDHPLTRSGTIVRADGGDQIGIHFCEESDNRPEYRRWFRGKCTISLLSFPARSIFCISGQFSLEASALLQTIFSQQKKRVKEILVDCHQLDEIATTAGTVFRTALNQCGKEGIIVTLLTGNDESACKNLNKTIVLTNGIIHTQGEMYECPSNNYIREVESASQTKERRSTHNPAPIKASPEASKDYVMVISRAQTTLNRLVLPFEEYDISVRQVKSFTEAVDMIMFESPLFVVADIDLENCSLLLHLNKTKDFKLPRKPPLLIIGPNYIYDLIKAALDLPVGVYLPKPNTDRDYRNAISQIIQKTGIKLSAAKGKK